MLDGTPIPPFHAALPVIEMLETRYGLGSPPLSAHYRLLTIKSYLENSINRLERIGQREPEAGYLDAAQLMRADLDSLIAALKT